MHRTRQLIKDALLDNDFLKNLSSAQTREVIDYMETQQFTAGAYLLREGEAG